MPKKPAKSIGRVDHYMMPEWMQQFFITGVLPGTDPDSKDSGVFLFRKNEKRQREIWKKHKDEIMPDFVRRNPGTRPHGFWNLESKQPKQRQQVGGIGKPIYDYLNYAPKYRFGIPVEFVDAERAKAWANPKLPKNLRTEMEAIDPMNPPMYESQAEYLRRNRLLTKAEEKKLTDEDFEPEKVNT